MDSIEGTTENTLKKKEWIKPELNSQLDINKTEAAGYPVPGEDGANWAS